jgi:hypothetical protein
MYEVPFTRVLEAPSQHVRRWCSSWAGAGAERVRSAFQENGKIPKPKAERNSKQAGGSIGHTSAAKAKISEDKMRRI